MRNLLPAIDRLDRIESRIQNCIEYRVLFDFGFHSFGLLASRLTYYSQRPKVQRHDTHTFAAIIRVLMEHCEHCDDHKFRSSTSLWQPWGHDSSIQWGSHCLSYPRSKAIECSTHGRSAHHVYSLIQKSQLRFLMAKIILALLLNWFLLIEIKSDWFWAVSLLIFDVQ